MREIFTQEILRVQPWFVAFLSFYDSLFRVEGGMIGGLTIAEDRIIWMLRNFFCFVSYL